jgi:hypothetical protein
MHGVLRDYTLDATHVDEVIRRIAQGGVPIIRAIPGFVAYSLLDAGKGHLVTYSVYESKMGAEESTRKAAAWVKENLVSMVPTPPRVLEGAVRLREVKAAPTHGVIRRYRIDPGSVEQIVARARDGFLPLVTHLPGFATYSILDAGKGMLVTLSGFTSPSGAADSTRAAATFVKENLAALVPNAPEVTSGPVRLVERAR